MGDGRRHLLSKINPDVILPFRLLGRVTYEQSTTVRPVALRTLGQ